MPLCVRICPKMAYYAIYGVFFQGVASEYLYPGCVLGESMGVSGCIQGVSGKEANRLTIGRQPSTRDRSLGADYTRYTLDTLDAPKIHLRYTPGYTLDTPHIHPRYTRIHLGQRANSMAKDH